MSAGALLVGFGRVGLLGFGGGPSMIPLMQAECVGAGWVTEEQFLEGLAAGNALPGPIATKMALYVGWIEGGWLGAAAALVGVTAPSLVMMALLSAVILRHREHPAMAGALSAVKPAVIGMLAWVAVDLAPAAITHWIGVAVALVAFAALAARVHPGLVMLGALSFGAVALRG